MVARTLIFFVLLLFTLTPVVNAYEIHDENIWIFQGAYQLGIGDRAELEGFTVKLHTISDEGDSATILIYRNGVFKEAYFIDADANSEQIYQNELKVTVTAMDTNSVSMEVHKQKNERVWITSTEKTGLKAGDLIEDGDYIIKFRELTEEGAVVSIEKQGDVIEKVYKSTEYEKIPDEFLMNLVYINKNTEEAFIETFRPGKPEMEIFARTDMEEYYPSEMIEYQFSVSNKGTIPLHGLILNTSVSEGTIDDTILQHASLEPTKIKKFVIAITPPISPVAKNITINSDIRGYDYKGNEYSSVNSIEVPIKPYIAIDKDVEILEKSSFDTEFGTDEYFRISLTVENMAGFQTAITITDELTESFIPDDMENPDWVILMEPFSEKTIEYHVKPTAPGNFTFGTATAQWKYEGQTYSINSVATDKNYQVHGLKAIVEKSIVSNYLYPGDETDVIVRITNTGDKQIVVSMSDEIAPELELVSGKTSWKGEIDAGDTKELVYTIMAQEIGDIYLPAANIEFKDANERHASAISGTPILYVDNALPVIDYEEYMRSEDHYLENETNTMGSVFENPELTRWGTMWFLLYSFISIFLVLAIVPVTAYLFISGKNNS